MRRRRCLRCRPSPAIRQRNFRFFDNRQKYLLFVNTCSEKWEVAHRVSEELAHIHPRPPAVRVFDAGVGDGSVLVRVMRAMHDRFPHMPFYTVGKEISLEDIRLTLQKMSDRFFEHPATVLVLTNLAYADAPWLAVKSLNAASSLVWHELPLTGNSAHRFEQQIIDLEPFLAQNWKAGVSARTGNPVYERPVVLVIYREDHRFLLDPIIPKPGGTLANYDLVIASQPYRARAPLEFKAKRVIAPLARALGPGGRLIAIHSHGHDPGMEIIQRVWPDDNPFIHDRHQILKAVKQELGPAGRELNFNAYADNRSLFRYEMHTLPSEISEFDRHLDSVRRLERGDLCGAGRGRPARRSGGRRPLYRRHPFGLTRARRLVVLRRILRDLAAARLSRRHGRARTRTDQCACRGGGAHCLRHGRIFHGGDAPERRRHCRTCRARRAARAFMSARCRGGRRTKRSPPRSVCARAGFEPVPHVAVRQFGNVDALDAFLARLNGEAEVRHVLVVAGDHAECGPFRRALDVIEAGILKRRGIRSIGVAGYPDGHPRIGTAELDRALAEKIAAAEATGLAVEIVTQFCFDARAILDYIARLRAFGFDHPLRIGLAGPTGLSSLLRYASRCGVRASAQALAQRAGLVRQLFAMAVPDDLVRALADAAPAQIGDNVSAHFFSFGGLPACARWARAVADGRIVIDGEAGFAVAPQQREG